MLQQTKQLLLNAGLQQEASELEKVAMERQGNYSSSFPWTSPSQFLAMSFDWALSTKGIAYWSVVCAKLKEIQ